MLRDATLELLTQRRRGLDGADAGLDGADAATPSQAPTFLDQMAAAKNPATGKPFFDLEVMSHLGVLISFFNHCKLSVPLCHRQHGRVCLRHI